MYRTQMPRGRMGSIPSFSAAEYDPYADLDWGWGAPSDPLDTTPPMATETVEIVDAGPVPAAPRFAMPGGLALLGAAIGYFAGRKRHRVRHALLGAVAGGVAGHFAGK